MTPEAIQLANQHGGTWGEHPAFPLADWRYEVEENDTRLGYWDWVLSNLEQAELDAALENA